LIFFPPTRKKSVEEEILQTNLPVKRFKENDIPGPPMSGADMYLRVTVPSEKRG
jgi:hypothetical protein